MNISILDASNYFKGLLLLMRKDRKISQPEIDLMKHIGRSLGFEKGFCDNAINEILENRFIVDLPPAFSSKELAIKFVKDGFALAYADNELDGGEEQWLKDTVERNGLDTDVLGRERENAAARKAPPSRLEVDDLTVDSHPTPSAPPGHRVS